MDPNIKTVYVLKIHFKNQHLRYMNTITVTSPLLATSDVDLYVVTTEGSNDPKSHVIFI